MKERKRYKEETKLDHGKTQNEKASGQEDHFSRLPQELFIYILTIVSELKSLFQCSLVSKHFASVVSQVQTVRVTIRGSEFDFDHPIKNMPTLSKPEPLAFLEKFRELEYIYLEYKYKYLENISTSPFVLWKAKFTNFPNLERFVYLLSASVYKKTANEPRVEQVIHLNDLWFIRSQMKYYFSYSFSHYLEWMIMLYMLSKSHTSLKKVKVTDSGKQGKLVITGEQIDSMRSYAREPCRKNPGRQFLEFAYVPELQLPIAGYVMKSVFLLIRPGSRSSYRGIDEILSWNFDDDEKVLGEACKEVYKNHRDKFKKVFDKLPSHAQ